MTRKSISTTTGAGCVRTAEHFGRPSFPGCATWSATGVVRTAEHDQPPTACPNRPSFACPGVRPPRRSGGGSLRGKQAQRRGGADRAAGGALPGAQGQPRLLCCPPSQPKAGPTCVWATRHVRTAEHWTCHGLGDQGCADGRTPTTRPRARIVVHPCAPASARRGAAGADYCVANTPSAGGGADRAAGGALPGVEEPACLDCRLSRKQDQAAPGLTQHVRTAEHFGRPTFPGCSDHGDALPAARNGSSGPGRPSQRRRTPGVFGRPNNPAAGGW